MSPEMPGQMPSSFDNNRNFANERALDKVFRKLKEEPLVPIGTALTVAAFVNAYRAIRRGDSQQANRMFRARVGAQGFTIFAMLAGSLYYSKDREKSAELRKLQEQKDAEKTRDNWIRELEARDNEEKAMRARILEKREKAAAAAAAEAAAEAGESGKVLQEVREKEKESGGLLGKMGLWSAAEKKADEERKADEKAFDAAAAQVEKGEEVPSEEKKSRKKKNPNSSLGALGEIMTKPKEGDDPKGPKN